MKNTSQLDLEDLLFSPEQLQKVLNAFLRSKSSRDVFIDEMTQKVPLSKDELQEIFETQEWEKIKDAYLLSRVPDKITLALEDRKDLALFAFNSWTQLEGMLKASLSLVSKSIIGPDKIKEYAIALKNITEGKSFSLQDYIATAEELDEDNVADIDEEIYDKAIDFHLQKKDRNEQIERERKIRS